MDFGDIGESRTALWRKMKVIAAQHKTKKKPLRRVVIAKSNKTINQLSFHKYVRKVTAAIGRINGNRYAKVGVIAFDVGFVAWAV